MLSAIPSALFCLTRNTLFVKSIPAIKAKRHEWHFYDKLSIHLPDTYRAVNKTDVVEIRRNTTCGVDPEPTTIPQQFKRCCAEYNDALAIVSKDDVSYTYTDYYNNALKFAKSAIKVGLKLKDTVAFIGFNSPEYHFGLHGTWLAGGVTAGIYTTNSEEACRYVLDHSESVICVCQSGKQLTKILSIRDKLPRLKVIVAYWQEEEIPAISDEYARVYKWEDFLELGEDVADSEVDARIEQTKPGSCATLIYTSGTTGDPKGVMCSHDSCTYNAFVVKGMIGLRDGERFVGYLPLNHVAAQYVDCMLFLYTRLTVYMARPDALRGTLVETLKKAKPTVFVGVPRVYEKMMDSIKAVFAKKGFIMQSIISWARSIGLATALSRQYNQTLYYPWGYFLANRLVFSSIRDALGLSEAHVVVASAAPITEETVRFFASFDITILDLLGQSEGTAPIATCTNVGQGWKIGTVGRPLPGVELITGPNDEIMYKGRNVMMGYLKQPDETIRTLDPEGYLHTGDQGVIDEDGFLRVTGRIKELIVTAGGENVAPVVIENKIMELSPIISCCVVVGDRRKFLSLLVCLRCDMNPEGESTHRLTHDTTTFLNNLGSHAVTVEEAMDDEIVKKHIDDVVAKYNESAISQAQQIRKWCILPNEFTVGSGELTATMKLRRNVVQQHYANEINALYVLCVCCNKKSIFCVLSSQSRKILCSSFCRQSLHCH